MVNTSIAATSVIGHRSSILISKEKEDSGIISDNHISKSANSLFFQIQTQFLLNQPGPQHHHRSI